MLHPNRRILVAQSFPCRPSRRTPDVVVGLLLLLLLLAAAAGAPAAAAAPIDELRVLFIFPVDLLDLGFVYQYNIARRAALRNIAAAYPSLVIEHHALYNFNLLSADEATTQLEAYLDTTGSYRCELVFGLSTSIFPKLQPSFASFRAQHLSTRFVELNLGSLLLGNNGGNYAAMGIQIQSALFLVGAAAGAACVAGRPVGMLMPIASASGVNAFYKGMLFGQTYRPDYNRSNPLHNTTTFCELVTVNQNSFADVTSEVEIAELFLKRNATVLFFWIDHREANVFVKENRPDDRVFSIAYASDGTAIVGDSVLTSLVLRASAVITTAIKDFILGVPTNSTFYLVRVSDLFFGAHLGSFSAKAPKYVVDAGAAAQQYAVAHEDILCGPLTDQAGVLRVAAGVCLNITEMQFGMPYFLQGVSTLPDYQRSSLCTPGTYTVRNASDFTLTCTPCPDGAVSAVNGARECTPCGADAPANAERTGCVRNPSRTSLSTAERIGIVVPLAFVGCALLCAMAVYLWMAYRYRSLLWLLHQLRGTDGALTDPIDRISPPAGPQVAVAMLAVDNNRSDTKWRKSITFVGHVYSVLEDAVTTACVEEGVYIAINVGDMYILAHQQADALLKALAAIDESFRRAVGNPPLMGTRLALRVLLHRGTPVMVSIGGPSSTSGGASSHQHHETPSGAGGERMQLVGPDIRLMKLLWGSTVAQQFSPYMVTAGAAEYLTPSISAAMAKRGVPVVRGAHLLGALTSMNVPLLPATVPSAGGTGVACSGDGLSSIVVYRMVDFSPSRAGKDVDPPERASSPTSQQTATTLPSSVGGGERGASSSINNNNEDAPSPVVFGARASVPNVGSTADGRPAPGPFTEQFSLNDFHPSIDDAARGPQLALHQGDDLDTMPRDADEESAMGSLSDFHGGGGGQQMRTTTTRSNNSTSKNPNSSNNVLNPHQAVAALCSSLLEPHELNLINVFGVSLVGRFLKALDEKRRLDVLMYCSARLHLVDVHSALVIPPLSEDAKLPDFSDKVILRTEDSSAQAQQERRLGAKTTAALTQKVARSALKAITSQIVLTMDEVELKRWLRDAAELRAPPPLEAE